MMLLLLWMQWRSPRVCVMSMRGTSRPANVVGWPLLDWSRGAVNSGCWTNRTPALMLMHDINSIVYFAPVRRQEQRLCCQATISIG